jgi:transcriptional regulator with XRE-family HTH domain
MKKQQILMSQAQIAKKIGVTQQALSKWFTGKSFPSFKNLTKLAKVTNMTVNEVVKMLTK